MREEADRKARIEAEKQKVEQQERLIKEEKEREARRKRVEAIMLRTRGKQNANNQQVNVFSSNYLYITPNMQDLSKEFIGQILVARVETNQTKFMA